MQKKEAKVYYPSSISAWRKWLEKNHVVEDSVWLVFYNKSSKKKSLTWSEAVDVALCFGWIDSKKIKIDEERSHQFFSKRKAKSTWSKINKEKVELLIVNELMAPAGYLSIEVAKKNGSWTILDSVEDLIIPKDLEKAFKQHKGSKEFFLSLSKTAKKMILHRIVMAKLPDTRQKRVDEIAKLTGQKKNPVQA